MILHFQQSLHCIDIVDLTSTGHQIIKAVVLRILSRYHLKQMNTYKLNNYCDCKCPASLSLSPLINMLKVKYINLNY